MIANPVENEEFQFKGVGDGEGDQSDAGVESINISNESIKPFKPTLSPFCADNNNSIFSRKLSSYLSNTPLKKIVPNPSSLVSRGIIKIMHKSGVT